MRYCRRQEIGAEGVVIGALRPDGQVDSVVAEKLIKAARPMRVTWHRAFDLCRDPRQALQEIMALGCDFC